MGQPAGFELDSRQLGPLPIVNAFIDRVGLAGLLDAFVPHGGPRVKLAPAKAIGVVVRNLVVHREPVYALGEWAARFEPELLGLDAGEVGGVNDDRVGRALDRLFDCDRASLLTRLVLDAVARFDVDLSQLHNDSTSIRFAGSYADADGRARGGRPTAAIAHGHSKDHRPDLKQLVWILTVTSDGAVPIAHRVADGNTNDATTHIETWDGLFALTGRTDFLYVADCKLATKTNMDHIHHARGRFVSTLPSNRNEDRTFRDWLANGHQPEWVEAHPRPDRRGDPHDRWETTEAPWPSAEGYRVIWARSSAKTTLDAQARHDRIARSIAALDDLNQRLASPRTKLKDLDKIRNTATTALKKAGATRWIGFEVEQRTYQHVRTEQQGPRSGNRTRQRRSTRTHHRVTWHVDEHQAARDAASDGCFPLITNDRDLTGAQVLAAYKWQPNLEKRYAHLKGPQLVAPMFLRDPARIEALLCCHFIALLLQALIERHIRTAMADRELPQLSLYPEDRGCTAPTAPRILDIFTGLTRHHLRDPNGHHVQTFHPQLTDLQRQVLDLLDIPHTAYAPS